MPVVSTSWKTSRPSRWESTWPVMTTRGTESMYADATPLMRLVAPGPEVATQTPHRPLNRA